MPWGGIANGLPARLEHQEYLRQIDDEVVRLLILAVFDPGAKLTSVVEEVPKLNCWVGFAQLDPCYASYRKSLGHRPCF